MESQEQTKTYGIQANENKLDEDGFITIWDLAVMDPEGGERSVGETRMLASRILNFLCKTRYEYALLNKHDAALLDDMFDRDEKALFRWTVDSDRIDTVTQYIKVPAEAVTTFLKQNKFDANENYNPRKAAKVKWFQEYLCVE